jgi:hypothetical protein
MYKILLLMCKNAFFISGLKQSNESQFLAMFFDKKPKQ